MSTRRRPRVHRLSLFLGVFVATLCSAQLAFATDLSVFQFDTPDPVLTGQSVTYFVSVSNDAGPVTGVTVTDTLPTGSIFVSATPSVGTCGTPSGGTVTCSLGTLGDFAAENIAVVVTAPSTGGTITNAAAVAPTDATPADNTSSEPTSVVAVGPTDLDLTLAGPDSLLIDHAATFTYTVANLGPNAAAGVALNVSPPAGVTFGSAVPTPGTCTGTGPVSCDLGSLLAGGSATVVLVFTPTASTPTAGGLVSVAGSVTASSGETVPANNTRTLTPRLVRATDFATAVTQDPAVVTGAAFTDIPANGTPNAVMTTSLAGFPVDGTSYALLTSGDAALAGQPNNSPGSGAALGGATPAGRGDTAFDVTTLRVDLNVPQGRNCLSLDLRFLSEEFPEFVGSAFNDAFIAELDTSTWTTAGSVITAPNNFAVAQDALGGPVELSINAAGPGAMTAAEAAGTTYDGASRLLRASTTITPGPHSLFLSIFDQGDQILDSAVMLDRLVLGIAAAGQCTPGVVLAPLTAAKAADASSVSPGGADGYTITLTNPNAGAVTINSIADVLPAGFAYTPGSSTGATTADPALTGTVAAGQTLTWTGPFTVPASGTLTLHFNVTASATPGNYTNSVTAQAAAGFTVQPTGPTAPVDVVQIQTPGLSINDVSIVEGNAGTVDAVFTVARVGTGTASADFATSDGTAIQPGDYTPTSGTMTFVGTETTKTIAVPVSGDLKDELDETFNVTLTNPAGTTIADGLGIGTIVDDDAVPTLSIGDVTVTEGDAGTTAATFTVTLSAASGRPVTVDFASADGTAASPSDFAATSGTLTFAEGQTSKTVTVLVNGDLLNEGTETFNVNISAPVNATITNGVGLGTILDNDPVPTIAISDVSVAEGNAGTVNEVFTVTLSAPSGRAVAVDFATSNGTATAPGDYLAQTGTVSFLAGETSKTITVVVNGDTVVEPTETFNVNLTAPVNATIADGLGVGTITNDDTPSLSINDVAVLEGNAGTANAVFTVTRSSAVGVSSASFTTSNGTATAGSDYVAQTGSVSFADGDLTTTITVIVNGDTVVEPDETFNVTLSAPSNATITKSVGVGTITNDDAVAPSLSISDVSVTEGNAGTVNAVFTVTRTPGTGASSASFATSNGTATAPGDYLAQTGTVSFLAGETSKTITVVVNGDTAVEPDETFNVTLSAPSNATLAKAIGVGTITNDDAAVVPSLSINDASVTEGNAGTVNAVFTITRTPGAGASSVSFATSNVTATSPGDYVAQTGTVSFAAGETSKTITVVVNGDTAVEPDETFNVNVATPVNATIARPIGVGTITNDDTVVPSAKQPLTMTKSADKAQSKAGGKNGYTVSITNPNASAVTVVKVVDCLPRRFKYRLQSTSGGVSANPVRGKCGSARKSGPAPQQLTWSVSVVVPAGGSVSFHFAVSVGSKSGTFTNSVTALASDGYIVTDTGPTAPVTVKKKKHDSD